MKEKITIFFFLLVVHSLVGQDTIRHSSLDAVIVTATRNERSLVRLPVPVTLIDQKTIKTMGYLRLQDALAEQTGLIIVPQVNAQGNGLQLQGFNPDYSLILMDGEPLIGRYTGSLELSRVTTGNIRQIEIVKGPSSSLYGSEALAGVVNIITEKPTASGGEIRTRYGSNQTSDIAGSVSLIGSNSTLSLFANRFETAGYDLSPKNFGKTVSPFHNYTLQPKLSWKINNSLNLSVSSRLFSENQQFAFDVKTGGQSVLTTGEGLTRDFSIFPSLTKVFSNSFKTTLRFYATGFHTETNLDNDQNGTAFYQDNFNQTFTRPELIFLAAPASDHILTIGSGFIKENVKTTRYGDLNTRSQTTMYGFIQDEWQLNSNSEIIAGLRVDQNNIYGTQISPKLATSYRFNDHLLIRLSGGTGFKAPDFRQLYFNFNNSAAGGYSVLGSEVIREKLLELDRLGQIETYLFNPLELDQIRAERSLSFNTGFEFEKMGSTFYLNFFHNEITNLIESQAVALTVSGQGIFTYRNINEAFTRGVEAGVKIRVNRAFTINAGHQLLYAMDRNILRDVRNGKYFFRDPETLVTERLKAGEYFGLQNRSRHSGNFKMIYKDKKGWEASARFIWRSKFGVGDIRGNIQGETIPPSDINSNGILDQYDQFVSGYVLTNISLSKEIPLGFRFQTGIENLFNHREPIFIPNLPGRLFYVSAEYRFKIKDKQ